MKKNQIEIKRSQSTIIHHVIFLAWNPDVQWTSSGIWWHILECKFFFFGGKGKERTLVLRKSSLCLTPSGISPSLICVCVVGFPMEFLLSLHETWDHGGVWYC